MSVLYPNVPIAPGVPGVLRSILYPPTPPPALAPGDATSALEESAASSSTPWGIFDSAGNEALTFDSILEVDARQEYTIPTFPVQNGGFASYNKVALPLQGVLRLGIGQTVATRQLFLSQVAALVSSTDLYTVVTPEAVYPDVNFFRQGMVRRGAEGAAYLTVDVYWQQIVQVTAQYSSTVAPTANAVNPSAQPATNQGQVQPGAVDSGTQGNVTTVLGSYASAAPQ